VGGSGVVGLAPTATGPASTMHRSVGGQDHSGGTMHFPRVDLELAFQPASLK
jgi:hypothetical protein